MFDLVRILDCGGRALRLDQPRIAGIINVTPDSFSDGGLHFDVGAAIAHGQRLVEEGADLLDVGGESTRPGADEVSAEEEILRVVPVIEALAKQTSIPIAIDTSKAEQAVDRLAEQILHQPLSATTKQTLLKSLEVEDGKKLYVKKAAALIIGSPEFQRR